MPTPAKRNETAPTTDDFKRIAEAIRKTSAQAKAMKQAGLTRKAVVTLLHEATGLNKRDIAMILDAAESLASWCLTQ